MNNLIKILIIFVCLLCLFSCENAQKVDDDTNIPLFSIENKNYWVFQKIADSMLVNTQAYYLQKLDSTWILKLKTSSSPVCNDSTLFEFYYKGSVLYIIDYSNLLCTGQKKYYFKEITPNAVEFYSPIHYIFKMRDMGCVFTYIENHEIFYFTPSLGLTKIEKKLTDYNTNKLKTVYSLVLVESGYKQ